MQVVVLVFDAPLMSFGAVVVDQINRTDPLPYRAMLTGLCANALGLQRSDEVAHEALQRRLRYAARQDRKGTLLVDFQTVDLGDEGSMGSDLGWTFRGEIEGRGGGNASLGTHIRHRHYLADAIVTVVLTLDPPDDDPSLDTVSEALQRPARPLFVGRKCAIPSRPIWAGRVEAPSLRAALSQIPRAATLRPGDPSRADAGGLQATWPKADGFDDREDRLWARVEDRDFANAIHVGRRIHVEGLVDPPESPSSASADTAQREPD